jgi:pimeloyl-ACP methyl ester carboxylesterase
MLNALLSSTVDHIVAKAIVQRSLRRASNNNEDEDLSVSATYEHNDPETFFTTPSTPAAPRLAPVRQRKNTFDATWPSIAPLHENAAYLSHIANRTASARLFLHPQPARSAVILVHGYLGGRYAFEEHAWPIRKLFVDHGFDVALFTLPFHGTRKTTHTFPFPSTNPRFTNEGMRQAIGDIRALMRFFQQTRGTPHVGAMGMSLGGYTVALLATVEPTLRFVVPVIPLADLTNFTRGDLTPPSSTDAALRTISPLARKPLLHKSKSKSKSNCVVIGADNDAIAPIAHARALANHFDAPLETWRGGHILQLGRTEAFSKILEKVAQQ